MAEMRVKSIKKDAVMTKIKWTYSVYLSVVKRTEAEKGAPNSWE